MSKILVTGANGFVGRALVPKLINAGHSVICAVTRYADELSGEQVLISKLELQKDWSRILKDIDVVIHLAARVHVMKETVIDPFDEFYKINSLATQTLATQSAKSGVKRFIYLSSIKVNGESTPPGKPFSEKQLPNPLDAYSHSKLQAEKYLLSIADTTEMDVVILRPPLIFGPGVKANFLKMIGLVHQGWPLPFGHIKNKRSYVFIDNLISVILTTVTTPHAANQIYLVADDLTWSLSALLQCIAEQMELSSRLFYLPGLQLLFKLPRLHNIGLLLFGSLEVDNSKLKSQLGWEPPFSSQEGLKKTVAWYKNEHNT